MPERHATVMCSQGLHARPAATFARAAAAADHAVTIRKTDGNPVSAKSTLMLMSLGLKEGEAVILASDDETAGPSLDHLAALLATELDER
ncbi:HPr family phosphocarrier protein [Streptomyces sp. S3(2020)]|uniref:HPr family phosphocarrier protein n=1 Tax=Streptomyces sp. S3(2020) TaxID=2732044 RepID=UPI00148783E8|nr:HPr family phosphocarrier protein [Streptomyces sp. S3(2020)]NNN31394.1 HPr family phosphocarrier protein [Streptomyces sp. S3(2020)]